MAYTPFMRSSLRTFAALVAAGVLLVSGCSSDDDDATDDTTTTEASEASTTTADDATSSESEPDDDATEGDDAGTGDDVTEPVATAFTTFFDDFAADPALLQDGDQFTESIEGLRAAAAEQESIGVEVHEVTELDEAACQTAGTDLSPCAEVTFDLVVNGEAAVPNQTGYAVYQDDTWKVSKTTFCALTALGSGAPDAC